MFQKMVTLVNSFKPILYQEGLISLESKLAVQVKYAVSKQVLRTVGLGETGLKKKG